MMIIPVMTKDVTDLKYPLILVFLLKKPEYRYLHLPAVIPGVVVPMDEILELTPIEHETSFVLHLMIRPDEDVLQVEKESSHCFLPLSISHILHIKR
jgi:hypothetical protein